MNDAVTKQKVVKGWDDGASEDLFPNIVKLCAKFNKSKDHKDLIHVGQVGLEISDFGHDRYELIFQCRHSPNKGR